MVPADYGERPLKLVLKVSGNEVTTGSSSLDTFYDDQPDHDKPKDKKKKKKKDKERGFGSPEDDTGKKKVNTLRFTWPLLIDHMVDLKFVWS